MPYEGVGVSLQTYRLDLQIDDTQQDLILGQQNELEKIRVQVSVLEQDNAVQAARIRFLEQVNTAQGKTSEELQKQLATLYKITQKPRFKIPVWVPTLIGVGIGGYTTYRIMR